MTSQALVLDFGGVISRTLFETHALSEQALGLPPGTLRWRGPFDPASDPLWQDMQADRITERDYWMQRTREADVQAVIRPEAVAAIQAAQAAGCRLAVLSNELDLFYGADFRQRLPLMDCFEVVVDATYTQILKPDPRAYALVTEALGLPPERCVFVDDQARNIAGAQRAGWQTVQFDVMQPRASFAAALGLLGLATPSLY